jgi:hypothetical protein
MTIEGEMGGDSGGDPEDIVGVGGWRLTDAGDLSRVSDRDRTPLRDAGDGFNNNSDISLTVNRGSGSVFECADGRSKSGRRSPPTVPHRNLTDKLSDMKVWSSDNVEEGDGTEDENGKWKFVLGYSRRRTSDPAGDLRPMGAKSRFWALEDDDDSDEEVMSQSPSTLDLVRHAAVHGFSRAQLYDAEMAMQDSSVHRRVEEPVTPDSTNAKAVMIRNIMKALIDVRWTAVKPWSEKLPRPRVSLMMTLGDCSVRAGNGQRSCIGGTLQNNTTA